MPKFNLSTCARLYLHALVNPFVPLPTSDMPCIPDFITLPSHKILTQARGTMTMGTNGLGFIIADPFTSVSNGGGNIGTNTSFPVLFTNSTFAGTTLNYAPIGGTLPSGVVGVNSNSLFTAAGNPLGVGQYRLVGAGLRARYSGNEVYRGGSMILYRIQQNSSVISGLQPNALLTAPLATLAPVTRGWHSVTFNPDESQFLEYHTFSSFYDSTQSGTSHYSLLIVVQAPVVSLTSPQQTFDFELNCYYEVIGANLSLTHSDCDPIGNGAVKSVTSNAKISQLSPEAQEKSYLKAIMDGAWAGISGSGFTINKALEYGAQRSVQKAIEYAL